jgi:hypothetical protein
MAGDVGVVDLPSLLVLELVQAALCATVAKRLPLIPGQLGQAGIDPEFVGLVVHL